MTKKALALIGDIKVFFVAGPLMVAAMVAAVLLPEQDLFHQPWFPALIGLLGLNLVACILSRLDTLYWGSLLVHAAIVLVMAGAAISSHWGHRAQLVLRVGDAPSASLTGKDGEPAGSLPFSVALKDFRIDYHSRGRHHLSLAGPQGAKAELDVEPGKSYPLPDGRTLEVLRYIPDFVIDLERNEASSRSDQPNNPALQLRVSGGQGQAGPRASTYWAFADFPLQHQEGQPWQAEYSFSEPEVKQYTSQIEVLGGEGKAATAATLSVNHPFRWMGWTLYQSGFDPGDSGVSVLQATHDPGTPLVFLGCIILLAGLSAVVLRRY